MTIKSKVINTKTGEIYAVGESKAFLKGIGGFGFSGFEKQRKDDPL